MNLSIVPPCSNTASQCGVRYWLSSDTTWSGESFSEKDVKPATSLNRTVIARRRPPNSRSDGSRLMASMTDGARKRPNVPSSHFV